MNKLREWFVGLAAEVVRRALAQELAGIQARLAQYDDELAQTLTLLRQLVTNLNQLVDSLNKLAAPVHQARKDGWRRLIDG